jgi:hypothetical protein
MISLRSAVLAALVAAALAGCITYFVTSDPPQRAEADQRLSTAVRNLTDRPDSAISKNIQRPTTEDHMDAYQRAAKAILERAQNATASAGSEKPLVTGPVPLPKPRPVPRP